MKLTFNPYDPASRIAAAASGEGVYRQNGACWYWDGSDKSCQVEHLSHLSQDEFIAYGRSMLEKSRD